MIKGNWKTSLIGLAIGGGDLLWNAGRTVLSGQAVDWHSVLVSIGVIGIGVLAKDYDKSHAVPASSGTN
jgi:hypothetical protein